MPEIKAEQLFEAIEQIASQNLLSKEEILKIMEEAVIKIFHSKFDPDANLELKIDQEKNIFQLINHSKLVIDDEEYEDDASSYEIPLSKAKKIDANIKTGDTISEIVDFSLYSRSVAGQMRQMFTQAVRENKKEVVYAKHKDLKGKMIEVEVTTVAQNYVIAKLEDGTTAFMPPNFRNSSVKLRVGERIKVMVEDVLKESKDAQIIISNSSKIAIKKMIEEEVPEINDGLIKIVDVSRIPGERTKISVQALSENIDPVGAIIGPKGSRISSIIAKLDNEKVDVILYSDDINQYVANALSPAKIVSVLDKNNDSAETLRTYKVAIAPNNQQTLAIGRRGSNVRLAVELTKVRIDVLSVDQAREKNINFDFNVGLSEDELARIEQGERVNNFNSNWDKSTAKRMNVDEFDASIESFTNEIEEEITPKTKEDLEIDDNLFSEDQLREMEANFEFDNELANFNLDDEDTENE